MKAFEATQTGMSVYRASKVFSVPESTLRDRTRCNVTLDAKPGPKALFTKGEEEKLVRHINSIAETGQGYNGANILQIAKEYAVSLGKKVKSDIRLSNHWLQNFKQRWPDMKVVKASNQLTLGLEGPGKPQSKLDKYCKKKTRVSSK